MKNLYGFVNAIIILAVLATSSYVQAQSVESVSTNSQLLDCAENIMVSTNQDKTLHTIVEEDFPYLKRLECVTNGYFFDTRNLELVLNNMNDTRNSYFTVKGASPNMELNAAYNQNGELVEATFITKNIRVPRAILRFIYSSDEFAGWTIESNEKIVKDFELYQTEYKIALTNGEEKKVLRFKDYGDSIAFIDR